MTVASAVDSSVLPILRCHDSLSINIFVIHVINMVNVNALVRLKFRIVDLTNPWGPHFTVQVANFPLNLISCFLTEFLKRWKFSGFTAHCFTDKHAIHNAFRSSGIQKFAKLSEPRFGLDTSHPETEVGQKSTVCQGLLCPGVR